MLSKQQMLDALDGLIDQVGQLRTVFLADLATWTPDFVVWLKAAESTVEVIFGSDSDALRTFKGIYFTPPAGGTYANDLEQLKAQLTWYESGLRYARDSLVGYRYAVDRFATDEPTRPTPYIFLSHGGPTLEHVNKIRDFLEAVGLVGIIVQDMPNLNFSIHEKVRFYLSICAAGIALATVEDETTAAELRARPNVENEIGLMQAAPNIGGRIIYLREPKVQFASNYSEKVWIPFERAAIEQAFTPVARDLRAFGFFTR